MKIVIASQNPVKLEAVKQAFAVYFENEQSDFIPIYVPSGVSDQPMSANETAEGARIRAFTAAKQTAQQEADFAIGVEGGISFVFTGDHEHAFEQTWACVLDCKTGVSEIASGPAVPIPPRVLSLMQQEGKNLTDAMAMEYGTEDIGAKNGYVGWLSKDRIDRTNTSYQAVYLALCGLLREER